MSATSTSAGPDQQARRARVAVAMLFLTNGALFANLVPRLPQIKADLDITNSVYGLMVAAYPAGAIAAGMAAGVLIRRFGSARVAVATTIITSLGLVGAGTASVVALVMASLLLAGASDAITDVAQNAHGLRVQRRYGRSIINSFHALWSAGAVIGGSMAAAAIALDIPRSAHLAGTAVLFSVMALLALRLCLPGKDGADDADHVSEPEEITQQVSAARGRIVMILGALVLIGIVGTLVEDAGNSWAAVYLSSSLGATAALAATGYIALTSAQFVGRLLGDRMVDRFGQRTVARSGGVLIAAGMGLALAFPSVPGTIAGFAAAGFGVATLVPLAMHEADELPGLRPGTGLTIASWLMRLGFLLSPPIVGLIADASTLRTGLLIVPVAGVVVIVAAGALKNKKSTPAASS